MGPAVSVAWLGFILAAAVGVPGIYFGFRSVRSATLADRRAAIAEQRAAHEALNAKLAKAAAAERELCRLEYEPQLVAKDATIAALRDELKEMRADRDYYRNRDERPGRQQ